MRFEGPVDRAMANAPEELVQLYQSKKGTEMEAHAAAAVLAAVRVNRSGLRHWMDPDLERGPDGVVTLHLGRILAGCGASPVELFADIVESAPAPRDSGPPPVQEEE